MKEIADMALQRLMLYNDTFGRNSKPNGNWHALKPIDRQCVEDLCIALNGDLGLVCDMLCDSLIRHAGSLAIWALYTSNHPRCVLPELTRSERPLAQSIGSFTDSREQLRNTLLGLPGHIMAPVELIEHFSKLPGFVQLRENNAGNRPSIVGFLGDTHYWCEPYLPQYILIYSTFTPKEVLLRFDYDIVGDEILFRVNIKAPDQGFSKLLCMSGTGSWALA